MIDNLGFAADAAWQVLLISLLFGAGLPALFAVGVRTGSTATVVGRAVAGVCFAVVVAGVALGITIVAATGFGKAVSFEHGYPTIVKAD